MLNQEPIDHDEACAQEVGKRLELGCFEEQIVAYATCYKENGIVKYFMSETAENAYRFIDDKLKEEIYCLPVVRYAKRMLVPSGKRADLMQTQKLEAGRTLLLQGGDEAAERIEALEPRNNSSADGLLQMIKDHLIGCFEEEKLQLFEGLIDIAYFAKKLTAIEYLKYQNWLKTVRETVEAESIVHDVHERVYSGFSYLDDYGNVKYYYNAVKANTMERQSELRRKKVLTTPVIEKRYCFNKVDYFNNVIEDFKELLKKIYDETYWNMLFEIYNLPSAIDKDIFLETYKQAEEQGNRLLLDTLKYYGVLWQVWEIKKG